MTPKEKTLKAIIAKMDKSVCGMFATYGSLEAVNKYAKELLESSSLREREFAALTVTGIYHNTLVRLLKVMITDTFTEVDGICEPSPESLKDAAMIKASGLFLTEPLPDDFRDLCAVTIANFIDNHAQEDHQDEDEMFIWEAICDTADAMVEYRAEQ